MDEKLEKLLSSEIFKDIKVTAPAQDMLNTRSPIKLPGDINKATTFLDVLYNSLNRSPILGTRSGTIRDTLVSRLTTSLEGSIDLHFSNYYRRGTAYTYILFPATRSQEDLFWKRILGSILSSMPYLKFYPDILPISKTGARITRSLGLTIPIDKTMRRYLRYLLYKARGYNLPIFFKVRLSDGNPAQGSRSIDIFTINGLPLGNYYIALSFPDEYNSYNSNLRTEINSLHGYKFLRLQSKVETAIRTIVRYSIKRTNYGSV